MSAVVNDLPVELLLMVMDYLSRDYVTILRTISVCRYWNDCMMRIRPTKLLEIKKVSKAIDEVACPNVSNVSRALNALLHIYGVNHTDFAVIVNQLKLHIKIRAQTNNMNYTYVYYTNDGFCSLYGMIYLGPGMKSRYAIKESVHVLLTGGVSREISDQYMKIYDVISILMTAVNWP